MEAVGAFERDIPALRKVLEDEFRTTLGGVDRPRPTT